MSFLRCLVTLGAAVLLQASVSEARVELEPHTFFFPRDGQPNDNDYVGPFCCTGRTAVVTTIEGAAVGYVYFYDFPGGGVTVGNRSYAANLSLLISAATDPYYPGSGHDRSEIFFRAEEMRPGFTRHASVGGLSFTAEILKARLSRVDGQWRYEMGSVAVKVTVAAMADERYDDTYGVGDGPIVAPLPPKAYVSACRTQCKRNVPPERFKSCVAACERR